MLQYNTVKPNLKGLVVLLQFRDIFGLKIAKIKKNSGHDISFGSSNRFGLNIFGLIVLYCITKYTSYRVTLFGDATVHTNL